MYLVIMGMLLCNAAEEIGAVIEPNPVGSLIHARSEHLQPW